MTDYLDAINRAMLANAKVSPDQRTTLHSKVRAMLAVGFRRAGIDHGNDWVCALALDVVRLIEEERKSALVPVEALRERYFDEHGDIAGEDGWRFHRDLLAVLRAEDPS